MYIVINDEKERWVDLEYPNVQPIYEISNYGDIRFKETKEYVNKLVYSYDRDESDSYYVVSLRTIKHWNDTIGVHILVAWMYCKHPKDMDKVKYVPNHLDSNHFNNYYKNLEWITYWENSKHGILHGRIKGTTMSNGEKLIYTRGMVETILELLQDGYKPIEICKRLDVEEGVYPQVKALIKDLKRKRTHKDISANYNIKHEKRNLFSLDTVHEICKLLQKNYSDDEIISELNIPDEDKDMVLHKIYNIKHKIAFVKISDMYNIPKSDNVMSSYSDELVHNICKLLQEHRSTDDIIEILGLLDTNKIRSLIKDIRTRKSRCKISKNYYW